MKKYLCRNNENESEGLEDESWLMHLAMASAWRKLAWQQITMAISAVCEMK